MEKNPIARRLNAILTPKYCARVTIIEMGNFGWGLELKSPTEKGRKILNSDKEEIKIPLSHFSESIDRIK